MKKIFIIALTVLIAISCGTTKQTTQEAPPVAKNHGYAYCRTFFIDGNEGEWYKLATIQSKGNLGKHVCVFQVYSTVSPHYGVYYSSWFLNFRRGGRKDEMYGHFYCTDWGKDDMSNFSPADFCATFSGDSEEEVTTIIWKRKSNIREDYFFMGVEWLNSSEKLTFAENSYYGKREHISHKPSVADGYDFVIDVEDTSRR